MKYNKWNVVTNNLFIDSKVSKSKYFKKSMGKSLSVESNTESGRALREGEFTTWYQQNFSNFVYKKGTMGLIHFYCSYSPERNPYIYIFLDNNPKVNFSFPIPNDIESFDTWFSSILIDIEKKHQEISDENSGNFREEEKRAGNAENLKNNPGSVKWADIVEYYKSKK